jgi:ABC-type Fe3+/spermidine/putrescine transport system ATPase subunit
VTHDQREAFSLSDRVAILNEGHIEQSGTPSEVRLNPKNAFVARFCCGHNVFDGVVESINAGSVTVRTPFGVFQGLEDGSWQPSIGSKATYLLDSKAITIDHSLVNSIEGVVVAAVSQDSRQILRVELLDGVITKLRVSSELYGGHWPSAERISFSWPVHAGRVVSHNA